MLDQPPATPQAAQRERRRECRRRAQRRYRDRVSRCATVILVEITGEVIGFLERTHWCEADAGKAEIGRGIAAMLKDAARR
jgi:hypothetical protein